MAGLDRAPGQAAQAVDLATLHRERDLVGARIARDHLDRRIEHVLVQAGEDIRLRVRAVAAERGRLGDEVLPGLNAGGVPGDAEAHVLGDAAEPAELGGIEARAYSQQWIDDADG